MEHWSFPGGSSAALAGVPEQRAWHRQGRDSEVHSFRSGHTLLQLWEFGLGLGRVTPALALGEKEERTGFISLGLSVSKIWHSTHLELLQWSGNQPSITMRPGWCTATRLSR